MAADQSPLKYEWKITGIKAKDDLITQASYHCRVQQKDLWVATEGTWFFKDPRMNVPYREVTEAAVVAWIKEQDEGLIEKRLAEQIANLASKDETIPPWKPQVFTVKIED